jgi:hypothetical protein
MDKRKLTLVETIPTADEMEVRSCIDVLERALADARAGNILACAISMVASDRRLGHMYSDSPRHGAQLIAAVGLTQWRLCEIMWHDKDVETEDFPEPPPGNLA